MVAGVVTSKNGEAVGTFLRRIGAAGTLLEVEARQVSRALRGELNRVLNAESANLQRAVSAAGRQLDAIETLDADGRLPNQPYVVRLVADGPARDAGGEPDRARRAPRDPSVGGPARARAARTAGDARGRPQLAAAGYPLGPGPRSLCHHGSMRDVIVAANWKMHTTPSDAGDLASTIAARTRVAGVTRVICPPFVSLAAVRDALAGSDPDVGVGAQNVHHELQGAYTGEIAAPMLVGLATWVIVGHSERRRDAFETDELIGRKLGRAVDAGLRPILCVGERLEEREAGSQDAVVHRQLAGALAGHDPAALAAGGLVIAYEPVWAIGTGRNASGHDAAAMAGAIRDSLSGLGWGAAAGDVPVLYGGSVTSANIAEFLAEPSIDGALVGGASLKPDEMAGIVARAGLTAAARGAA